MEIFTFYNHRAYALLFAPVHNPQQTKQRIIDASKAPDDPEGELERDAVNFSFIDAELITSPLHLQTAIQQSIISNSQHSLKTKTIHSEILFALNPTNNITEAIRRYGVSESTKSLLVVHILDSVDVSFTEIETKIKKVVQGTIVPFTELAEGRITNWDRVKKYHKLPKETSLDLVDNIATSSVAMKSVMQ